MEGQGDHRISVLGRALVTAVVTTLVAAFVAVAGVVAGAVPAQALQCVEWDENGVCIRWESGGISIDQRFKLPVPPDPLPENEFYDYALTSTCDGGGPPGQNTTYTCAEFRARCAHKPGAGLYQLWKLLYRRAAPEWKPVGDFVYVGSFCLTRNEGADHDYQNPAQRWLTHYVLLPAGTVVVQPKDATLVGRFDTNFYTPDVEEIRYSTYFAIGGWVRYRANPQAYVWNFGDGTTRRFTSPGRPYPDLDVTHRYTKTGTYEVSMTREYRKEILREGQWQPFPHLAASRPGTGYPLEAYEIMPRLLDD